MKTLIKSLGISFLALTFVSVLFTEPAGALHGPIIKHEKGPVARQHAAEHRAKKAEHQMRAKHQFGGGHGNCS